MATITLPDQLYILADAIARSQGSSAERKARKALRDVIRRQRRALALPYGRCVSCGGLTLPREGVTEFLCIECGAIAAEEGVRYGRTV